VSNKTVGTLGAVLFTDLVDSTQMRSRLGDDAAEEMRRRHDSLLTQAVTDAGGSVVKGLGDGIMAVFLGAAEAVGAAVAMQCAVGRWNRRENVGLAIRVGISAGDLIQEDGDCFGVPVIEASRLCGAAVGDQIVASEVVRLLSGTRGGHVFDALGALELKGLASPVTAWEVRWAEDDEVASTAGAMPPGLTTEGQFPFVARLAERETMARALKLSLSGERRIVLIAGEPGVGKTRLCAETARAAAEEGAVVLFGRCDEELGIPYQPFVEALRWHVASSEASALTGTLGTSAGELARLAPELAGLVPGLPPPTSGDADVERARLFEAVVGWLDALGVTAPVVLILDDLHWAGRPTLQLLRHVVRCPQRTRLLVLGTYRDTDLSRSHPLAEILADFRREPAVERVNLKGLDRPEVQAFLEAAAGHELGSDEAGIVHTIHDETDGNPFFLQEMLVHLGESGAVYQGSDGRWRISASRFAVPEGVREVVGRRVSRLSQAANTVLGIAAVIGQQFSLPVLEAVSDLLAEEVEAALDEAAAAGLVRELPTPRLSYRFSHALVRSTLAEELSTARRVRLHRRIGEAIEATYPGRLDDHLVELAHHFSEAAADGDVDRAVEYCRRAAWRAGGQLALDEAVTWFARALEVLETGDTIDPRTHSELRIDLGDAMFRAGDPDSREILLDAGRRADALGAPDLVIRAAVASDFLYARYGSVDLDRVAALERALELAEDDIDRARVSIRLAGELTFSDQPQRAIALADEALVLGRRCDLDEVVVNSLVAKLGLRWGPENLGERLAQASEAAERAARVGQGRLRFFAAATAFYPHFEVGDVTAAARAALEAVEMAEATKEPAAQWLAHMRHTSLLLLAGRLADAEVAIERITEYGMVSGRPEAEISRLVFLGTLRRLQRRSGEIVDEMMAAADGFGPAVEIWLAQWLVGARRHDEAAAILDRAMASGIEDVVRANRPWSGSAADLAVSAAAVGNLELSTLIHQMLAPYPGQFALGPPGNPLVATDEALAACVYAMGDLPAAEAHLHNALALYERMAAPAWIGRARLRLSDVLGRLGRAGEAAVEEDRAGAALRSVGLEPGPLTLRDP
jgi:class 3 adenylate cyclase/tetratricopeptide (TPR) repeat protein